MFGITEPAIYGVTLRFKKPFIFGCISGAIGAIVASFFNPYYFAYAGLPSLLTIVNGINSEFPTSFIGIVIGCLIALVGSAALVMIFGFGETNETDKELSEDIEGKVKKAPLVNYDMPTPIIGEVIALTDVPDEVFASGAMGSGVAVKPTDNKVYAPFDGVVTMVIDSKHAIGLTSDTGIELLVHVGLDTVKLEGKPFKCHVIQGQSVKKGDLLLEFNAEEIEEAGYSLITPVIITNSFEFKSIQTEENNIVNVNDSLLKFN